MTTGDGSRSSGIPNDFIIDREVRIAWIGHPNHLEKPLQAVLAGTWDPAAERAKHLKAVEAYDLEKRLLRDYNAAKQEQRWEDAAKLADQLQPLGSHLQFTVGDTFEFLLHKIKDAGRAYAYARRYEKDLARDNAAALGRIARAIAANEGTRRQDLDLALRLASRAVELSGTVNPWSQASLAAVYFARGERDKAISAQQKAVAIAGEPERVGFVAQLHKYEKESE